TRPLARTEVAHQYAVGHTTASLLASAARPSGARFAQVSYDGATGTVNRVTDENGGTWQIGAPPVTGSSQVYASAVLGNGPADYWRLGDAAGTQPHNEVHGGVAAYNQVTLGAEGAFGAGDDRAAAFNGTSSYVRLPAGVLGNSGPLSVELWF